jgi:hypothetical protein
MSRDSLVDYCAFEISQIEPANVKNKKPRPKVCSKRTGGNENPAFFCPAY